MGQIQVFKFRCANHSEEPLKAKIMSAEASIISESPRHGTTIEFEHLYLSHLSFNFTGGNFFCGRGNAGKCENRQRKSMI